MIRLNDWLNCQNNKNMTTSGPDETAQKILEAASRRFLHYGYGKTTMSEIAGDCNMSTGNIYRYFPSKLDMAEAFVRALRTDQIAHLRRAIETPEAADARDRLRLFLRTKLKLAYERFHDKPKAYELSNEILRERPAFAGEWEAAEASVIVEILTAGEEEGHFIIPDKKRTARLIQDVVYRFTTPVVFLEGDFEALASELDDLVDLVLDALAHRKVCMA